jgi:hypothetical protein
VSNFSAPSINGPEGIAAGPDGALWFANAGSNSIGRITTAGAVTKYTDPTISSPIDIAADSDGALWFTNVDNNSIGRLVPPLPTVTGGVGSVVEGISGTTHLGVPITLSFASTQTVTLQWKTVFVPGAPGNQADPVTDYTPAGGTVTFAPGQTTATAGISVNGDTLVEPDEYIVVLFGNPTHARMGRIINLGFGGILNDD